MHITYYTVHLVHISNYMAHLVNIAKYMPHMVQITWRGFLFLKVSKSFCHRSLCRKYYLAPWEIQLMHRIRQITLIAVQQCISVQSTVELDQINPGLLTFDIQVWDIRQHCRCIRRCIRIRICNMYILCNIYYVYV